MRRWLDVKIGQRIILGFVFVAVLTLIVAGVSFHYMRDVGQRVDLIAEHDRILQVSALELQSAVDQESRTIRGYLLSGDQRFLEMFYLAKSDYSEAGTKLEGLVQSEEDKRTLSDINALHFKFLQTTEQEVMLYKQDSPQSAISLWQNQGNKIREDLSTMVTNFVDRQEVVIAQHAQEAKNQQNQAFAIAMTLVGVAWVIGIAGGLWISRSITRPIENLISTTEAISRGDSNARASIPGKDELARLGSAMNQMITELAKSKETTELLLVETRRRAEQLRTINEVGRKISSILSLEDLLPYVVNSIWKTFKYYNVNIFILDPDSANLVLKAGTGGYKGAAPIGLSLKLTEGMSGWVARTGKPLLINDVTKEPRYLLVEELADTLSELVVPIKIGDKTVGVLDIESTELDAFDETDMSTAQTLADQVAIAIENIRLYEQAQELAAMEERQRLARDLHDAVAQTLFSANMIANVLPHLWERNPVEGKQHLEELRKLTQGALAEMRMLLLELRPTALTEIGLSDLVRQLSEAITSRTQVPITLKTEGECTLTPDVQVALYHIAQEALNNIAKHARASEATVSLRCQSERVELLIHDNGCGFNSEGTSPDHLGLSIMSDRAKAIGASLKIESQVGCGTQVAVVWPDLQQKESL